ncbi:MAG TPA: DUF1501 domain-containing protein [Bryobacteraceae bacterium]|nr:DUF1501 domain-containing protein [Bryobacteraceae bacterium]
MLSRRGFVKVSAASVASLALRPFGLLPALAQSGSSDYRALVCVFLFGGNDSNNMVVPVDDTNFRAYSSIRGSLALTAAELTPTVYAATGNAPYAFHGDLAELASMFSNKELAVVANVGSLLQPTTRAQYQAQQSLPLNLFSHSDQQLQWQTSVASGHSATGWAGRAADLIASQNSSNFPTFLSVAGNSLMGTGVSTQPVALNPGQSLDLKGFNGSAASNARLNALENLLTLETGLKLVQASNAVLSDSIADAKALDAALSKATPLKTTFPKTGLGAQLQQVAQIIQVRDGLGMSRQIFFASLGGFDTHTVELETHRQLYPQLSQALAAFSNALVELGVENNVTTFTESDFSRTFQPTTGDGSDHAWGSHHLVMGGAVKGGDIYGQFPTFVLGGPNDTDTRGRWIPTIAIDQYGATLCKWFGIPVSSLSSVFPNFTNFGAQTLSFLG